MTNSRFYSLLGIFSLVAILAAAACHYWLPLDYALPLTIGTIVGLLLLTVVIFLISKRTAAAENKHLFGNAFMGITMVKLFLCGGTMVAYVVLAEPENKLFVVPFFLSYLVYTSLEVMVLVKLAATGK
jgi:hypothetical protein